MPDRLSNHVKGNLLRRYVRSHVTPKSTRGAGQLRRWSFAAVLEESKRHGIPPCHHSNARWFPPTSQFFPVRLPTSRIVGKYPVRCGSSSDSRQSLGRIVGYPDKCLPGGSVTLVAESRLVPPCRVAFAYPFRQKLRKPRVCAGRKGVRRGVGGRKETCPQGHRSRGSKTRIFSPRHAQINRRSGRLWL